jgi:hypothetical protein
VNANTAATPSSETEPPPTPTPSTPITPQHPNSFTKNVANATTTAQQPTSAPAPMVQQQPDPNPTGFGDLGMPDVSLGSSFFLNTTLTCNSRPILVLTSPHSRTPKFWRTLTLTRSSTRMPTPLVSVSIQASPTLQTAWKQARTACELTLEMSNHYYFFIPISNLYISSQALAIFLPWHFDLVALLLFFVVVKLAQYLVGNRWIMFNY